MFDPEATGDSSAYPIHIRNNAEVGTHFPLNGVTEEHARQFRNKYNLPVEEDVFIRGVLAVRSQQILVPRFKKAAREAMIAPPVEPKRRRFLASLFSYVKPVTARSKNPNQTYPPVDLKIGNHTFTKLEVEVLQNAWTRGRMETLHHLSRLHWLLIVACIFAAMTQGWDQAAMAGAAIEVMNDLGKPLTTGPSSVTTKRANYFDIYLTKNMWLLGVTVGVPFFAGAALGLILTDPITKFWRFGRRGAICVAGLFSFISVIGSASIHQWSHLLGFRILLGAGMAGKASIVPILLSETSPKNVRGILLVCWQLFVAFGLAAGSVANMSVYHLDTRSSWRYMFIAAFIPALLLFSLVLFSPESPRWLLKESGTQKDHDKNGLTSLKLVQDAFKSLVDLRGEHSPILVAGELYLMHKRLIQEQNRLENNGLDPSSTTTQEHQQSTQTAVNEASSSHVPRINVNNFPLVDVINHVSWWKRLKLMRRRGPMRRANYAAAAVMISQQLCGINLLAFLANTFFRYSIFHLNHETSPAENTKLLGFSLGFGVLNFVTTIPAMRYIDQSGGRRNLLNWSFPCMATSLLVSALVLQVPGGASTGVVVVHYIALAAFTAAYSIGEGPAAFVISAEVFPLINRELGMSLAVFWNFLGAGLLAVFAPVMMKKMGQFGILMLFSGTNLLAWFACYWLVPYTGDNEDLENVFAQLEVPTRFAFIHTLKTLRYKVTKPADFCLNCGSKRWRDCGYGENPGSARRAFSRYEADRNRADGINTPRANDHERVEMTETVASTHE